MTSKGNVNTAARMNLRFQMAASRCCSSPFASVIAGDVSRVPYPARSTASRMSETSARGASYSTDAVPVARLTSARATPGTAATARSIERTQPAHVIPLICNSTVSAVPDRVAPPDVMACSSLKASADPLSPTRAEPQRHPTPR